MRSEKLVLIVVLAALVSTSVFGSRVVVSLYAIELGANPALVGAIMAGYFVAPIVFSVPFGKLVDRAGLVPPLLLVAVLLITGHALPALWPSHVTLALSAGCIGTAFSSAMIALSSATASAGPLESRTANFSWFTVGSGFGVGLGPFISGFTIDALGHRVASLGLSLWPLAMILLLLVAGKRLPVVSGQSGDGGPARVSWRSLLERPKMRAAMAVSVLVPAGYEIYLFLMPVLCTRQGLSATLIGGMLGASAVAIFSIRLAMPLLLRWLREWEILVVVFATLCTGYLLLSFVTATAILFVISVGMGIAHGLGQPVVMSMYFTASPEGRKGEAAGLRGLLQNIFSGASPVFLGGLGAVLGFGPVLLAASAVYASSAGFSVLGARRQRAASDTA